MSMKHVLLIGLLLLPTVGSLRSQDAAPGVSGFSFVFRYGACWTKELDTANERFTYDVSGRAPTVVDLKLARAEMDQIEKKLESMDFWNSSKFPAVFRIPNNSNIGCGHAPLSPIFIAVPRGGIEKSVSWDDIDCQSNEGTRALRELETLIRATIESKPEYWRLPRNTGCA